MVKREELLALIEHGEDSTVEFKLDDLRAGDWAREIVAFSNLEGRVILLGVADDGQTPAFELPDENLFQVTLYKRRDNGNEGS